MTAETYESFELIHRRCGQPKYLPFPKAQVGTPFAGQAIFASADSQSGIGCMCDATRARAPGILP